MIIQDNPVNDRRGSTLNPDSHTTPTTWNRQFGPGKPVASALPVKTFFKLLLIHTLSRDLEPCGFLVLMLVKVWAGMRG